MPHSISDFKAKLFADGADKAAMPELYQNPWITGFITNPTLIAEWGENAYAKIPIANTEGESVLGIAREMFNVTQAGSIAGAKDPVLAVAGAAH